MSNQINIMPSEFKNVRTGEVTYGVRVYDDYDSSYDNTWESIPDDDLEVLRLVLESEHDAIVTIMDFLNEHRCDLYIGGELYTSEDYAHLFDG